MLSIDLDLMMMFHGLNFGRLNIRCNDQIIPSGITNSKGDINLRYMNQTVLHTPLVGNRLSVVNIKSKTRSKGDIRNPDLFKCLINKTMNARRRVLDKIGENTNGSKVLENLHEVQPEDIVGEPTGPIEQKLNGIANRPTKKANITRDMNIPNEVLINRDSLKSGCYVDDNCINAIIGMLRMRVCHEGTFTTSICTTYLYPILKRRGWKEAMYHICPYKDGPQWVSRSHASLEANLLIIPLFMEGTNMLEGEWNQSNLGDHWALVTKERLGGQDKFNFIDSLNLGSNFRKVKEVLQNSPIVGVDRQTMWTMVGCAQ